MPGTIERELVDLERRYWQALKEIVDFEIGDDVQVRVLGDDTAVLA